MLHLVTDFDIHIQHDGVDMGTVPVAFDGTNYKLLDACYQLVDVIGNRRHYTLMNRIMRSINKGCTYDKVDKTLWRLVPL